MFDVRVKAIKLLESQLKAFHEKAFPYATRSAINSYAYLAMKKARQRVASEFILRNKYTERSIRFNTTRSLVVDEQESSVGSVADYMSKQEYGGQKQKSGKYGVLIPTSFAAGQAKGSKPRRFLPRGANKFSRILLKNLRKKFASKKQQARVAVIEAAKTGKKFVFLDLGKTKGIFKIIGGKRNIQIRMLYDLSRPSIRIKVHPWLRPTVGEIEKFIPKVYFEALKKQLQQRGLFKKVL